MSALGIGIIGVGKIAIDQHIPAILANSGFELRATANLVPASIQGTKNVKDYQDLLRNSAIDAVSICTPPQVRYRIAREALEAGKHVLIEKPPAATLSELIDLASTAKGVTLFTAWHSQYNSAVEAAAAHLAGRSVSRLLITWKEDVRHWHPGQAWIWRAGGFGVFDPGINALSIITHILPEPVFITSAKLDFPSNCDAPIAAELGFSTPTSKADTSLAAVFDFRQTGPQTWDIEIETTDGLNLKLQSGGTKLIVDGEPIVDEPAREYPLIYQRFSELIAGGSSLVDDRPLRLVADAFLLGKRATVEPFYD